MIGAAMPIVAWPGSRPTMKVDAHDQDGDQEGVFAADHVAQAAEHQRAERTHDEAGGEGEQGEDEGGGRVADKELLGDDRGQRAVQVEVVPFENGAEGGSKDDLASLPWSSRRRHCLAPAVMPGVIAIMFVSI
jgi:hypothetical protein